MFLIPNHPVVFCTFVNLVNIVLFAGIHYWHTIIENDNTVRICGTATLGIVLLAITFFLIRNWSMTHLKSGPNANIFAVFYTFGFVSYSLDIIIIIDLFLKPNGIFISNYIDGGDDLLESIWMNGFMLFDVIVNGILFDFIIWRAWKGYSWRSLTVMIWAYFFYGATIYLPVSYIAWKFEEIHAFSGLWACIAIIRTIFLPMALLLSKRFTLCEPSRPPPKKWVRILEHLNIFLLDSSAEIIMGKKMGFEIEGELVSTWSNFIAKNDPGIFLNEKNLIWSYPRIQNWINLCFLVPTFMVSIYFNIKSRKPSWVWDVTLIQFIFLATGSFIAVIQEIHPLTPEPFQRNIFKPNFWAINFLPLFTSGIQLLLMNSYKHELKEKGRVSASKKKS